MYNILKAEKVSTGGCNLVQIQQYQVKGDAPLSASPVSPVVRLDAGVGLHPRHYPASPREYVVGLVFVVLAGHVVERVIRQMRLYHLSSRERKADARHGTRR